MMTIGCQEKITQKENKSDTLRVFDLITPCKENCLKYNTYLKYFGTGTLVLVAIVAVFYLNANLDINENNPNELNINEMNMNEMKMRDVLDISRPFSQFGSSNFSTFTTNPFI